LTIRGAKVDYAVTTGCTDGCVAAERESCDRNGRTTDGRIAEQVLSATNVQRELPDLRRYRLVLIDESHSRDGSPRGQAWWL